MRVVNGMLLSGTIEGVLAVSAAAEGLAKVKSAALNWREMEHKLKVGGITLVMRGLTGDLSP